MHLHSVSAVAAVLAALSSGMSIRVAAQATRSPGPNDRAAAIAAASTPSRWQAYLKATQQRSGRLVTTVQNKATGTFFMSQAGHDRVRVRLTVSTSYHDGSDLKWAIVPGRCGSNMMPIAQVEQFPIIEISSNGRGEVDRVLPLTILNTGQYHVNVYRGGTQLEHVLTCGNIVKATN
jgi:hypothetical protein